MSITEKTQSTKEYSLLSDPFYGLTQMEQMKKALLKQHEYKFILGIAGLLSLPDVMMNLPLVPPPAAAAAAVDETNLV